MDERKGEKPIVTAEEEIEAVVQRESAEALERFRSGDFAARLKSRLEGPLPRQPFFLFRRPVLIPAVGLLVLAAAALIIVFPPDGGNGRLEAGFRFMTEVLAQTDLLRDDGRLPFAGRPSTLPSERPASTFTEALIWIASQKETSSPEGSAPLRPLFTPNERFKILFGDQAILRVLTMLSTQKEG